jgi:hypothetical protein
MVTSHATRVADSGFLSLRLQSPHQVCARATSSPAFTPMCNSGAGVFFNGLPSLWERAIRWKVESLSMVTTEDTRL